MKTKALTLVLILLMSVCLPASADQVVYMADKLNSSRSGMIKTYSDVRHDDTQSCDLSDTGFVTVYLTNSTAQGEIDVNLDGMPVGSLSSYFPGNGPACKAANAKGVITLIVPQGKHTISASSSNLNWPGLSFTVKKCGCMLMPLS